MSTIIVTGGTGFIGSHICVDLLEKGYDVLVLDSLLNSKIEVIKNILNIFPCDSPIREKIKFIKVDLRIKEEIQAVFKKLHNKNIQISAVIHLAGLKAVKESVINPLSYWECNVIGAFNLISVMHEFSCRTIVFSSSATIYGQTEKKLISENIFLKPINPYGTTKFVIEQFLDNIFQSDPERWRIANLRYFNPIGAHESGLIGEKPIGVPNNIFPFLTQVAFGKLGRVTIFGNDWPTIDGTGIRDYIHVMDLAKGHTAALQFLQEGKSQNISFNLGTGLGTSVLQLINTFEKVNRVKIPYSFSTRREGDLASVIADNNKALSLLNWKPKRNIEDMCRDGWKWECKNKN